jgi:hypothetical protein
LVYVDQIKFYTKSDSLEELMAFAKALELRSSWFHRKKKLPHFDLDSPWRNKALAMGAKPYSLKE